MSTRINFHLPEQLARDFKAKTAQLGLSQTEVLEQSIGEFLENSKHSEVIVKRVLKAKKK